VSRDRASRRDALHAVAHLFRILLAAGLLAGLFVGGDPAQAQEPPSPEAVAHADAGRKALEEGKLAAARDELRAAIAMAPGYGDAHLLLGTVYARAERWRDALPCYERALEIGPARAAHHYGVGCCLRGLGDLAPARDAFTKARELAEKELAAAKAERAAAGGGSPDREVGTLAEIDYQLACVARESGDDDGAAAAIDRGLAAVPDHPKLLAEKGALLLRRGDPAGAVSSLEKARARAPDDGTLLYDLGRALLLVPGREAEGRAKLAEFRAFDEERRTRVNDGRRRAQAQALAARAELELRDGRKAPARTLAARALELDPTNELAKQIADSSRD
jgi:tetratricopeptide (TPR) repeat protein